MMKHLLSATLILLSTLSYAEEVPNTFSSGDTISSSQINANFSFLADAMARGNLTAMMQCSDRGYIDLDNQNILTGEEFLNHNPAFVHCISTDNTTFHEQNTCRFSFTNTSTCVAVDWSNAKSITWKETIEKNWLLHLSDGVYYFYKISDQ